MDTRVFARIWAIGIALTVTPAVAANAEEDERLTAAEITQLFGGNTLSGVFGEQNTRYAQRNHSSGVAVVHIEGKPVRLIPWFVKKPGTYCEDWAEDGVSCYQIGKDAASGTHYFVRADGTTSAFTVREGAHPITFE